MNLCWKIIVCFGEEVAPHQTSNIQGGRWRRRELKPVSVFGDFRANGLCWKDRTLKVFTIQFVFMSISESVAVSAEFK